MVCVCVEVKTTRSHNVFSHTSAAVIVLTVPAERGRTHPHTPPPRALLPLQTNSHSTQQAIVPWSIPWLSVQERGRDVLRDEDDPPRLRFGIIRQ